MPFSPPVGLGPDVHLHLGGRGSPAPSSSPRWPRCGSPSCRLATSPPRCWLHPSLWDGRRKGQQQRSVGRAVLSDSYHHSFIHSFSKICDLRAVLSARETVNTAEEFLLLCAELCATTAEFSTRPFDVVAPSHGAVAHLKWDECNKEMKFTFYLVLITLHLNSHTWLAVAILDSAALELTF